MIRRYLPEPPHCREYDPLAAEVAQLIGEQITAFLPAVTVEHIGSTAVPGCAGKGIVDLMVLYPEGELPIVTRTLADLGFQPQQVGHIHPESRPMRVGSLEHRGRIFPVHVHVIAATSPEVSALRRFREQLRRYPALVTSYVAWKRAIVDAGVDDRTLYTQQKSLFVEAVLSLPYGTGRPAPCELGRPPSGKAREAAAVQDYSRPSARSVNEVEH